MAKTRQTVKKPPAPTSSTRHLVEELEDQFQQVHEKLVKARQSYLDTYQDEVIEARERMQQIQAKLGKARKKVARAVVEARQSGTRSAKGQLKKARAASLLLADSLKEAKDIMVTAQSKLHAARPFDRKLAARAKVLAKFEKDWELKMQEQAAARATRAKDAAAKRRKSARKRAAKKVSGPVSSDK